MNLYDEAKLKKNAKSFWLAHWNDRKTFPEFGLIPPEDPQDAEDEECHRLGFMRPVGRTRPPPDPKFVTSEKVLNKFLLLMTSGLTNIENGVNAITWRDENHEKYGVYHSTEFGTALVRYVEDGSSPASEVLFAPDGAFEKEPNDLYYANDLMKRLIVLSLPLTFTFTEKE